MSLRNEQRNKVCRILDDVLANRPTERDALIVAVKAAFSGLERKTGKWTDDNACPFCGFQPWYERDIHTLSFCPNCGADMRGEKDETN